MINYSVRVENVSGGGVIRTTEIGGGGVVRDIAVGNSDTIVLDPTAVTSFTVERLDPTGTSVVNVKNAKSNDAPPREIHVTESNSNVTNLSPPNAQNFTLVDTDQLTVSI